MITVLIADDHTVLRDALRYLFEAAEDIEIIATASNGYEAVQQATLYHPDVALIDISLPVMNGFDATREISRISPDTQVLLLSMQRTPEYLQRALEVGASGYLLKDSAWSDLVQAVRSVYKGEQFISKLAYDSLAGDTTTDAPLPKGKKKKPKGK